MEVKVYSNRSKEYKLWKEHVVKALSITPKHFEENKRYNLAKRSFREGIVKIIEAHILVFYKNHLLICKDIQNYLESEETKKTLGVKEKLIIELIEVKKRGIDEKFWNKSK